MGYGNFEDVDWSMVLRKVLDSRRYDRHLYFASGICVELFSRSLLDKLGQLLFYRCISVLKVSFGVAFLFCVYLLVISFTEWLLQFFVNNKHV